MGINMAKVLDLFDYATGEAPNMVVDKSTFLAIVAKGRLASLCKIFKIFMSIRSILLI